ncbi:MAG: transglutaminase family protein [Proteobacteria bacterium]|nr:transglutaminase family protein [Pseudomonadota bacterium]
MKFVKILAVVFVLLPLHAEAALTISSWQESAQLNNSGKDSEVLIKGRVTNLAANQAMSSFSIIFDPRQNLHINRVISDDHLSDYSKSADYSFSNNALNIKFPQGKKNGETISIYFSYNEKYDKINEFLRQEVIYVPSFAAGAKSTVTFYFPGNLESATFNPNLTKKENSFVYSNVVPKDGVHEIIKLTPKESIWNISLKAAIKSDKPLGKTLVKVPTFFQSPHQKVENYDITSSINPTQQKYENSFKLLSFDTKDQELVINNSAIITTGLNTRHIFSRNAADYIKTTREEIDLLTPILQKIKSDSQYGNIDLYAKIGKFVHDYLRYDIRYLGRLPSLQEIVQNRTGVCTEYSRLFDALSRLAGIPSIVVDGGACGEYDECQGHSWNMIYVNGNWIEVDPTWDLMSGIVSSSHVYFNDINKGTVEIGYLDNGAQISVKMDLQMKSYK